ncbi:MAG: hypothetical protein FWD87_11180 [Spirochaetaceae bacterium]|nr:hypothetical protein [Spirochaetaceae bacterium]
MESLDKIINILLTIKKASLSINDDIIFHIQKDKIYEIRSYLENNNIQIFNALPDDQVQIEKAVYSQYNIQPYKDFKSFSNQFELSDFGKRTIVILEENENDILIFNNNEIPVSYFFKSRKKDFRVSNYYYLKKIKNVFLPRIADYTDFVNSKHILLSPECGKFEVIEGNVSEIVGMGKSLENTYKAIENIISFQKGWEPIIKNRIIRGLEVIKESKNRFYWLIINLEQFITITIKDYDVFLASHRHETILERYEHEKDIFSEKIRAVLGRISTNLLSIPITFSVVLFGLREIKEKWLVDIFLMALAAFIIFSCIIQVLFILDLNIIKKEIKAKIDYFLMLLPVFKDDFFNISRPQLHKILFLQILTCLMIIAFFVLYCYLAKNFLTSITGE